MAKQPMIRKSVFVQDDEYAAVHADAAARGLPVAEVLRELADAYVVGDIVLDTRKISSHGTQTAFHLPKETLEFLESHGKSQGYSFGMLMSALIEKKYLKGDSKNP